MYFLQQVLSTVENVAADTLKKEIPELLVKASSTREEVRVYIEEIYVKCLSQLSRDHKYVSKVTSLREQAELLRKHLNELLKDEVTQAKESVVEYKENLNRIDVWLSISSQMCEIHEAKYNILEFIKNKEYNEAVLAFQKIDKCLKNLLDVEKTETILSISRHISLIKCDFLDDLKILINTNVVSKCMNEDNCTSYTLCINKNEEIGSALKALSLFEENVKPLDDLVRFIWNANTFIVNEAAKFTIICEGESKTFKLTTNEDVYFYKDVFAGIIALAEFLFNNLNYELDNSYGSVLNYIGENIRDNLMELIIKNCLDRTIPDNQEDLAEYQEVIEETSVLQDKLIEVGIFSHSTNSILAHAKNVDEHYINKKCEQYLLEAENLMKKDLHVILTVGTSFDASNLTCTEFPQCSISKNVQEILNLVINIVETSAGSNVNSALLLETAHKVLCKYAPFVSTYHKTLLQTIPQQLAIFYNNCKYIIYNISQPIWNDLDLKVQTINESFSVNMHIFAINTFAENIFEEYLSTQIIQIEATIQDCGITASKTCEKLLPSVEKSIRQCLRQQELLKTVWQKILNYCDYNKSVGRLLDCLCKSIIKSILYLDDISSDAAENLVDIFKSVEIRGPKIFTDPKEINMFVENWHKFNELLYILNSKLINISDRWADGKGPLALHFKAEEVRTLIRALFQNTNRREEVLAHIRNKKNLKV